MLSARGAKDVGALATDGQGLYWIEDDGTVSKSDNVVYRLDSASGTVETFGTFAFGSGVGTLEAGAGAVCSSGLTDAFDTPVWRMSKG